MSESLAKIPVILVLTHAFKVMLTPPNPAPSNDELVPTAPLDHHTHRVRKYRLYAAIIMQYRVAAIETATILAAAYPSSKLSQVILSKFVFKGGRPDKLGLSRVTSIGAALFVAGVTLRAHAYRSLGSFFRYEISIQKDHRLIKTGPYAYVRHPSYSGLLLSTIGWFLWNFGEGSWVRESGLLNSKIGKGILAAYISLCILPPSVVTISRVTMEDDALRKKFGEELERWAEEVPYLLIPGIF